MPDELQRKLLRQCDAVTLLAEVEARWIAKDCGVLPSIVRVVSNAAELVAEEETVDDRLAAFLKTHPRFVLVCGRIEPRKNQRAVLRVLSGSHALVFAGGINLRARGYAGRFLREVEECPAAIYAGQLSPAQLAWLYKRAHVHVLFSWFEAAPLVDIEAWKAGCRVVTTTRSYAAEYAGGVFDFVDPSNPELLKAQIDDVMDRPRHRSASVQIGGLDQTWGQAAEKLVELYGQVLAKPAGRPEIAWTFPVV
jgi:glycosyltransferase involved in cell wall biosynthesis